MLGMRRKQSSTGCGGIASDRLPPMRRNGAPDLQQGHIDIVIEALGKTG